MEALLYLGCTVPVRNLNYELATRVTAERLGIKLHDLTEFGCCGFPIKSQSAHDALLVAARNLSLAEREGKEICALCNSCAATLAEAAKELDEHPELKSEINDKLSEVGLKYQGPVKVRSYMRLLWEEIGPEGVQKAVQKPLTGLRIAPHYGCHYLKPSEMTLGFDVPEAPHTMADLIRATGAEVVEYPSLTECCGGGVLGFSEETANAIALTKLRDVAGTEAHALALVCPFCNVMYEGQQKKILKAAGIDAKIPIVYYPQILGLALGIPSSDLGFKLNRVKPKELLKIVES